MKNHLVMAGTIIAALAIPLAANAQNNATTGAVGGAVGGAIVGGPVVQLLAAWAARLSAESPTTDVRNSTLTLCRKKGPPTGTTAKVGAKLTSA